MNTRKFAILLLFIVVITFVYYRYFLSSTIGFVILEEKIEIQDRQYIKVKFENNSYAKIKVPEIVWPFLKEGSEYSIGYKQNKLRPPFLTHIRPIDEK